MLTIFVKFRVQISTINYSLVFSLGQIVIFASCIVRQVASSGYLQNTFFMPWSEIAVRFAPFRGVMPRATQSFRQNT